MTNFGKDMVVHTGRTTRMLQRAIVEIKKRASSNIAGAVFIYGANWKETQRLQSATLQLLLEQGHPPGEARELFLAAHVQFKSIDAPLEHIRRSFLGLRNVSVFLDHHIYDSTLGQHNALSAKISAMDSIIKWTDSPPLPVRMLRT